MKPSERETLTLYPKKRWTVTMVINRGKPSELQVDIDLKKCKWIRFKRRIK